MTRTLSTKQKLFIVIVLLAALGAGLAAWLLRAPELPTGIAFGNGRLEALEVDVATKIAGRLASLTPREGERVEKGQVMATLDAEDIAAQLRAAEAQVRQAQEMTREAKEGVRRAGTDVMLALKTMQRSQELVQKGFITGDKLDRDRSAQQSAESGLAAARVRVAESNAAVEAAVARGQSLSATVNDTALKAPISGRVLYRLAEPGEVVGAGGKVLTLLDLSDVYMTIFLPTAEAGKVRIGSAARIVLDALPDQVLPATVSFVAPRAQFTPKEVETRSEREKLMFRVKVKVDAAWLAQHQDITKGGMPGMAYVRTDGGQEWPAKLQTR
jgi:HlyD family secretion protein